MRTWIRNPLAAWTGSDVDASGGLVVDGAHIVECLIAGADPEAACDQVFDASDCVLIPGLVNCHHHFYQTLTRAFPAALNKELFPWLQALYPVWAGLDTRAVELSTHLALAELMLSGCTLASDHHYLFTDAIDDAIDIQAGVAVARTHPCRKRAAHCASPRGRTRCDRADRARAVLTLLGYR